MSITGSDPDDLIQDYIELKEDSISPSHLKNIKNTLSHYESWLEREGMKPSNVTPEDVPDFYDYLQSDTNHQSDAAISTALGDISAMYNHWARRDVVEGDPIEVALSEDLLDINPSSKEYPHIALPTFTEYIRSIDNPWSKSVIVCLAKTGARASETANLDLRDININHSGVRKLYDDHGVELREEIRDRPDTIFITSEINEGEEYNGEVRRGGNKRSTDTYIPIDAELKGTLIEWLAVRPATAHREAHPLFLNSYGSFPRHTKDSIYNMIEKEHTRFFGDDHGLDTHFYRHYFTTHNRDEMGELFMRYFRGDAAGGDAIEAYTHGDWVNIRERYVVYELGVSPTAPPTPTH